MSSRLSLEKLARKNEVVFRVQGREPKAYRGKGRFSRPGIMGKMEIPG